jgi:hypothetical protein
MPVRLRVPRRPKTAGPFLLLAFLFAALGVGAGAASGGKSKFVVTTQVGGSTAVQSRSTLSGQIVWTASPTGPAVSKVVFSIDGAEKWTELVAPYRFNGDPDGTLDTADLPDGDHTLTVKAYASNGQTASAKLSVSTSNRRTPPTFTVNSSIGNGATLSGSVTWTATPNGAAVSAVDFQIDGTTRWTERSAPYQFNGDPAGVLDTTTLSVGSHQLSVVATAADGRTASMSTSVTVSNQPPSPQPGLPPPFGSVPRFGISTGYKILTRSAADQNFELDQLRAVGARIVRFDSTPGNQAQVDAVVNGVLARGMEPMLILFGTTGPVDPASAAAFARSQATKWKGRVRLYEFANEPDLSGWTGTTYARSLIPLYDSIKAVDANAIVIAGALWKGAGGPVKFVSDMYDAGARGHFDILSLHLYDDPLAIGDWNIWNMAFHMTPSVRSVMDAHGDQSIPIGATEAGGPVTTYGETGEASIVAHDFDALSDPRLAFVLVYSMMDDDVPGFGLLRPDRTRRPAWSVFQSRAT